MVTTKRTDRNALAGSIPPLTLHGAFLPTFYLMRRFTPSSLRIMTQRQKRKETVSSDDRRRVWYPAGITYQSAGYQRLAAQALA